MAKLPAELDTQRNPILKGLLHLPMGEQIIGEAKARLRAAAADKWVSAKLDTVDAEAAAVLRGAVWCVVCCCVRHACCAAFIHDFG